MEWVIEVSKEVANKFQAELFRQVRSEIQDKEQKLIDFIFQHYYDKIEMAGRWYHPYHILLSTRCASQLVRTEGASSLIVPAVMLHDIGYYAVASKENWKASENRIIHMQEGASMTAEILTQLNFYNAHEIGVIVGMVATHDNGYLGIPTRDPDRLALRDADRIWVMHFISFYKDWHSYLGTQEEISPFDLFKSRLISFYGVIDSFPKTWGIIEKTTEEDRIQSQQIPYKNLAKQWRDKQFEARYQEICDNIIRDKEVFRAHAEKHIQSEIAAGRG